MKSLKKEKEDPKDKELSFYEKFLMKLKDYP